MRPAFYDDPSYRKKQSEITKRYLILHPRIKTPIITRTCNNSKRLKRFYFCIVCNKQLHRANRKYCSVKCQRNLYYNQYIDRWKQGLEDGNRGISTHTLSGHLRRYLLEKFGDKCSRCGWNQKHPKTLIVPLEINHIDGNSENNKEENLELICPNCHALTPNFRNLNKGNDREWRINYLKVHKTQNPSP